MKKSAVRAQTAETTWRFVQFGCGEHWEELKEHVVIEHVDIR